MRHNAKKRLVIYAIYDRNGKIDDYIFYCINELGKIADELIVVSNNILESKSKEKLVMVNRIYERSDEGYDMGGFADVIRDLEVKGELRKYDELILLNDSIFGPFYPLTDMFYKMDEREMLDFWGITKRGISNFDGGEHIYQEHIQLYFYVIRKRMLHSKEFVEYWNTISKQVTDFRSAIIKYEFGFTKHFEKLGYIWDVYCHTEAYDTNQVDLNLSPYHYASYELIKEMKCPFLKRKMCTGDFVNTEYCDKSNVRKAMTYIDKCTTYDIDLIWKHILRVYNIGDILEGLQMYQIVDERIIGNDKSAEKVRIWEIGNVELESTFVKQGEQIPLYTLVLDFRNLGEMEPLKQARKRCVIDNLFPKEGYGCQIIKLFEESPRLGVLIPPLKTFGALAHSLEKRWENPDEAVRLYCNHDLNVPFNKERSPIHKIDGFLCRSELLNKEVIRTLQNETNQTMMQMIPLLAQERGYYTEVLMKKNYASTCISNLENAFSELWKSVGIDMEADINLRIMKDEIFKKKITDFYKNHKNIYLYGAGQLAYRIIRILQDVGQIEGVVVSDIKGNESTLGDYQIQCIDDIVTKQGNFIIAVGEKHNKDVLKKLLHKGIEDYIIFN